MQVYEYRRVEVRRDMDLIREILAKVEADPRLSVSHFMVFSPVRFSGPCAARNRLPHRSAI